MAIIFRQIVWSQLLPMEYEIQTCTMDRTMEWNDNQCSSQRLVAKKHNSDKIQCPG